jgi:hypothetical protein
MSFLIQQIFWAAVLPAAIAAGLLFFFWRAWGREGVPSDGGTPLALAVGYLFAHWRIIGLPRSFPPVDSSDWLFVTGVLLAIWGGVEHFLSQKPLVRHLGRLVLVAVVSWLVLRPLVGNVWQGVSALLWIASLAAGWWLWWSVQARFADEQPGFLSPLILSMVAGGGGFILLWSNSSSLSQMSGAVAAVAGVLVPLTLWRLKGVAGAGGLAFPAGMLGLIWVEAIAFVPVPIWRIVAMAVASLSPFLALAPPLRRRSVWVVAAWCVVVTAAVLVAVMVPTYRAYVASAGAYGY